MGEIRGRWECCECVVLATVSVLNSLLKLPPSLPGVAAGGRGGLGGAGEYKAEWRGRQAGRSNPAVSPSFPGSAPG